MARCICCGSNVDIIARLTHQAGLPAEVSAEPMQMLISRYMLDFGVKSFDLTKKRAATCTVLIGG